MARTPKIIHDGPNPISDKDIRRVRKGDLVHMCPNYEGRTAWFRARADHNQVPDNWDDLWEHIDDPFTAWILDVRAKKGKKCQKQSV